MKTAGGLKTHRTQGSALLMMTLMIPTVLIPMAGLAIDVSILYLIKAKLTTAVDGATLAAARSLSRGSDLASQRANALATAQAYWDANFPAGHMLTRNRTFTATVDETQSKMRTVNAEASVDAPLYFLRVIGFAASTVRAAGSAVRRDVDVMLVLDRSDSLDFTGSCGAMKSAAISFISYFAEGRDKVGLLTFGGSYRVDFPPGTNFKSATPNVTTLINSINCAGFTGTAQALWQGYQQLAALNEAGALNSIVLFTDGQPNSLTASFPVKTQTTSYAPTGKSTCTDSVGRTSTMIGWNPGPKTGVLNGYPGSGTTGLTDPNAGTIPVAWDPWSIADSAGCYFQPNPYDTSTPNAVVRDIAYVPDQDTYGNSTWGYLTNYTYSSGPYAGKIRTDVHSGTIWDDSVTIAATNATDNAASRIRTSALKPVIFAIGLGGATDAAADVLLRRLANDPQSPIFDPGLQPGLYIYSPTTVQLKDAFDRIASELLRLSQ